MTRAPGTDRAPTVRLLASKATLPNINRSTSHRRQRLREEALLGNANALKHGIYAIVANLPDISAEVAVQYAIRPALDPLADLRLVESFVIAAVQHRRAVVALSEGWNAQLAAHESRLGALAERLERALHERDAERRKAATARETTSLDRYKPTAGGAS